MSAVLELDGKLPVSKMTPELLAQAAQANGVRVDEAVGERLARVAASCVDFSVGHVEAVGSLCVMGGVKDLFQIRMSGDVKVAGLVEQARIECGGALTLRSGMAGRGKGSLEVGGEVRTPYLNGVDARVRGTVFAARELVNCNLMIGGALEGESASLIGGETVVSGAVRLGSIGSPSETPTVLHMGRAAFLEDTLEVLERRRDEAVAALRKIEGEHQQLCEVMSPTAAQKERQMELEFEMSQRLEEVESLEAEISAQTGHAENEASVDITVVSKIFPRVMLVMDGKSFMTHELMRGPVTFRRTHDGELVALLEGGRICPIGDVCGRAAAA